MRITKVDKIITDSLLIALVEKGASKEGLYGVLSVLDEEKDIERMKKYIDKFIDNMEQDKKELLIKNSTLGVCNA